MRNVLARVLLAVGLMGASVAPGQTSSLPARGGEAAATQPREPMPATSVPNRTAPERTRPAPEPSAAPSPAETGTITAPRGGLPAVRLSPPVPPVPPAVPPLTMPGPPAALVPPDETVEPLELLFLDDSMAQAVQQQNRLQADGLRLLRRQVLGALGGVLSTYRAPDRERYERWSRPPAEGEPNHRYALMGSDAVAAQSRGLVGWPATPGVCKPSMRVGMVDGALDVGHPALIGARVEVVNLLPSGTPAAPADHGTAVASILVGQRDVPGLLPRAQLLAVVVMRQRGAVIDTTAELLIRAIDRLVQAEVRVVNLSLGGPSNRWLAQVLQQASARGVHLVAAAGNGGPVADPVFPASHPAVLAVTAVDLAHRIDPRAQRGAHIALAAPGVDIPVAQAGGVVAYRSGSSYAAPFVSAALALGFSADSLRQQAIDLGEPGRDPTFGWGLLKLPGGCGAPLSAGLKKD